MDEFLFFKLELNPMHPSQLANKLRGSQSLGLKALLKGLTVRQS